jgi:hypothetical protein
MPNQGQPKTGTLTKQHAKMPNMVASFSVNATVFTGAARILTNGKSETW